MGNDKKKLIIIGGIALGVLFIGFMVWAALTSEPRTTTDSNEPDIQKTIDPDTGDEIITVPGKDKEFSPDDAASILGGAKLIEKTSLTNTQYDLVVESVQTYAKEKVGESVNTIKFLPDTVEIVPVGQGDNFYFKVQVKTVGPENILNLIIRPAGLEQVRVEITNVTNPGLGTYDSGILPIDEEGDHSEFDAGEGQ